MKAKSPDLLSLCKDGIHLKTDKNPLTHSSFDSQVCHSVVLGNIHDCCFYKYSELLPVMNVVR